MRFPCKKRVPMPAARKLCRHCRQRHHSSESDSTSDNSDSSTESSTESSSSESYTSHTHDSSDSESTYSSDYSSSDDDSPGRRAEILSESTESGTTSPVCGCTGTAPKQEEPKEEEPTEPST